VAEKIKETMGETVNLGIFTNDSMEAMKYKLRSATSVFRKRRAASLGDSPFPWRKMEEHFERALVQTSIFRQDQQD